MTTADIKKAIRPTNNKTSAGACGWTLPDLACAGDAA